MDLWGCLCVVGLLVVLCLLFLWDWIVYHVTGRHVVRADIRLPEID
jgi:hypothetical protein